jgi:glucuronoarabinoxylan endo-1,4-beta-xylanase
MEGFGGAIAFYVNYVARHPNRSQILQALFVDLGIQMLRIGNWYQNNDDNGGSGLGDTVAVVQGATAALGHPPLIEMSSWSPPATLKSNGHVKAGGTLAPAVPGGDRYADFAQWWVASLAQYAASGVVPDYVSLQNEPDYVATGWQTCLFDPTETATNAGYDKALDALAGALAASGQPPPKLLGPEIAGIAGTKLGAYVNALSAGAGIGEIYGIAHHLYSGSVGSLPTSFGAAMTQVAGMGASTSKPLFMTEYGPTAPNMFDTAWLINTAVTVENVSTYLYWPLTWVAPASGQPPTGLITTESPTATATWKTANGFTINDLYYGVRHFSKWIQPGWQRVDASASASVIALSAFASPDGQQLTVVLLNVDSATHDVTLDPGAFAFGTSAVYRTSGTNERTTAVGPLSGPIMMPSRSIVTVTLSP